MRDSSPCSVEPGATLTRALVGIGTCALLLLIVIAITGGFTLDAGPIHLSAHSWPTPLLIGSAAWGAAARRGWRHLAAGASECTVFVERRAVLLAAVAAACAAGVGIGYGTYAASGSDAAGYVTQAELLTAGRLAADEPLARLVDWPNATWAFSPLGYRPGLTPGTLVPTYPPGLPIVLAAAVGIGGPFAAFLVVPILGALAVLCAYALAARLHSRIAGVVAAALLATSPIFLFQLVQPMSDVAVAAWLALACLFATGTSRRALLAAGAVTGLALLTRPNLLPVAAGIAAIAVMRPQASRDSATGAGGVASTARVLAFLAAGALPVLCLLLFWQSRLYGLPFSSGYGAPGELFAWSNVVPNLQGYGARLLRGEPSSLVLLVVASLVLIFGPHGVTRLPLRAAGAGVLVTVPVVACYLAYGVFAEWFYLRFLLPALPAVFVMTGAAVAAALVRVPAPARGVLLLGALSAACAVNVRVADREQAFRLRDYEARYRVAGRYLEAALPRDAVVIASQESASARFYTGRSVVRWDLLDTDLDSAVETLSARGRPAVFLVEDWEAAALRRRHPRSVLARLDWPVRAEVAGSTTVRVFDPRDRSARTTDVPLDRLR